MPQHFGPEPVGATSLSDEDLLGLRPIWISNRSDLNQAEAQNIANAFQKFKRRRFPTTKVLDAMFVRELHKSMYSEVWTWAGQYRLVETTIGIAPAQIPEAVVNLLADATYWLDTDNSNQIDKAVTEIHHRLVAIHPFRNGNGRLCRFFADLILTSKNQNPFSWGGGVIDRDSDVRSSYISALRKADHGNYQALYDFVRS
jgi:Fic-DOC domain mobile mystery protein B